MFHWNGDGIKDVTRGYVASQRQESLTYRFDNEKMIVDRSMKRPLFGWGGYGGGRIRWMRGGTRGGSLIHCGSSRLGHMERWGW